MNLRERLERILTLLDGIAAAAEAQHLLRATITELDAPVHEGGPIHFAVEQLRFAASALSVVDDQPLAQLALSEGISILEALIHETGGETQ